MASSRCGNHDYCEYNTHHGIRDLKKNRRLLFSLQEQMGWHQLMNEHFTISHGMASIEIIGVENAGQPPFTNRSNLKKAKKGVEKDAFKICQKKIREHGLEMKLIDAEYTFDNNKVLFYFTADGRIDFRQLVKDLAAIFKTRIELRQIGVRDETKILGGIGICGRSLCCHTYLSEFAPVSIKMAKEQNLSLNQTKISGVCGRLMCCLKNEQETYEELNKKLPGIGDTVTLSDGIQGTVQSVNVLRQRVKVVVEVNDEKEIQEFPVNELKFRPRKKKVKVSEKEMKELEKHEDREGDKKSHGKKSAN